MVIGPLRYPNRPVLPTSSPGAIAIFHHGIREDNAMKYVSALIPLVLLLATPTGDVVAGPATIPPEGGYAVNDTLGNPTGDTIVFPTFAT